MTAIHPRTPGGRYDVDPGPLQLSWQRHLGLGTTAIAFLAIAPMVAALVLARPWLVGLGAVPLVALAVEAATARPPRVEMATSVSSRRVVEGETVDVELTITADEPGILHVVASHGGGLDARHAAVAVELFPGEAETVTLTSEAKEWGRGSVGLDELVWRTPLGLITWRATVKSLETVWVHPRPVPVRSRLGVSKTTARTGPHRARVPGSGVEYHSSRRFEPGDRWRDVDHRMMARTDEAWTPLRHAERSRDVVVVVDLIDDGADVDAEFRMADESLRAAEAVVERHLADRDRVGILVLGARMTALSPRDGRRQGHAILDRLMRVEGRAPSRVSHLNVDLRKRTPSGATVLVISPLFDRGIIEQIHGLRRNGRDVAVLQVGHGLVTKSREDLSSRDRAAADLTTLRWEAVRAQLRADRIAVVPWEAGAPVDAALESVQLLHNAMLRKGR